uniref:TetR family transcriptional regulator C-terminal domain-containing protein n=1 Tax=Acetivibrio cellulolyticus TaxID=35830 RepID=UPI0013C2D3B7|nr:TetR family transcriptional regulator C-terminal domain-containing protein [Acetivibrio cellulolyticus]
MNQKDIFNAYQKFTEEYIAMIKDFYQKGINSGEFIPHNARQSAIALMSALDGVLVYMALDKKLLFEEVVESLNYRLVEVLLNDNKK